MALPVAVGAALPMAGPVAEAAAAAAPDRLPAAAAPVPVRLAVPRPAVAPKPATPASVLPASTRQYLLGRLLDPYGSPASQRSVT